MSWLMEIDTSTSAPGILGSPGGLSMAFPAAPGILSGRTLWGYFRCPGTTPWWRTTLWTSLRIGGGADESLDIFQISYEKSLSPGPQTIYM